MKLSIAELWMGVHPNGMSNVALSKESLADYIRHPSDPLLCFYQHFVYTGVYIMQNFMIGKVMFGKLNEKDGRLKGEICN